MNFVFRLSSSLRPTLTKNFTKPTTTAFSRKMSNAAGTPGADRLTANHLFSFPQTYVAVVTGGATGIGLMITQALATNGAKVYITGRREKDLENVAKRYPGKIIPVAADITDEASVQKLVAEVGKNEPKGIHLLVNNAGVAKEKQTTSFSTADVDFKNADSLAKHLAKATRESWAETFETNVTAQYFTSVAFVPLLAAGTKNTPGYSSSIVNIASISGVMKNSSRGQFAYAASKAAFLQLTRNLATTLKEIKVRVNSIAPGIFPSEMTADSSDEAGKSSLEGTGKADGIPAGRTGSEQDMAAAILYLAGPGGVFVNGLTVYVDGGNLLTAPSVA
ncbi:short chain dehydrogenase/reductase [Tricharina praecox]|uniref:short chain dehydrogenase/reductase n=1 Tax=Tricharina praecox TaxID=43433 RepID=UPI00221F4658|nr:short chain dehydrogenase/reductase [Tricharina praecox]KAI5849937.1 short chain dehydrogenase/reductase [Tricharina praecox]